MAAERSWVLLAMQRGRNALQGSLGMIPALMPCGTLNTHCAAQPSPCRSLHGFIHCRAAAAGAVLLPPILNATPWGWKGTHGTFRACVVSPRPAEMLPAKL